MLEHLQKNAANLLQIIREVYTTPLALPLLLAIAWRAYTRTLTWGTIPSGLITAALVSLLYTETPPAFLNLQKGVLDSILDSLANKPDVLAIVQRWDFDKKIVSGRTAWFSFAFFSAIMLRYKERKWYEDVGILIAMVVFLTAITLLIWSFLVLKLLPLMIPRHDGFTPEQNEQLLKAYRRAIEYAIQLPLGAAGLAMTIWVLGAFLISKYWCLLKQIAADFLREDVMTILITLVILGFSLSGFLFLQPYQATLWLLFWVISYPVALSFTRALPPKGNSLLELYKAGLKQVPFIGHLLSTAFGARTAEMSNPSDCDQEPPANNQ